LSVDQHDIQKVLEFETFQISDFWITGAQPGPWLLTVVDSHTVIILFLLLILITDVYMRKEMLCF
jgi:hypothetical protein